MSAERNVTIAVPRMHSKDVADFIGLHVVEANLAEAIGQPGGASPLAKRGSSDARHLHLIFGETGFLRSKPLVGRANLGQYGDACHFLLHRRINVGSRRLGSQYRPRRLSYNVKDSDKLTKVHLPRRVRPILS